jgi:hypothetical protein
MKMRKKYENSDSVECISDGLAFFQFLPHLINTHFHVRYFSGLAPAERDVGFYFYVTVLPSRPTGSMYSASHTAFFR